MTSWRHAFRVGFAPQFSVDQLRDLRAALVRDDPKLIQRRTTRPRPSLVATKPEAACVLGYVGWHSGEGLATVGQVEDFFAETLHQADVRLGEHFGSLVFLNWFDDTPRSEMRPLLIAEIDRELEQRLRPDRSDDRHRTLELAPPSVEPSRAQAAPAPIPRAAL